MQEQLSRRRFVRSALIGVGVLLTGLSLGGCGTEQAAPAQPPGSGAASAASSSTAAVASPPDAPLTATEFLFDTVITLSVYGSQEVLDAAVERCRFFERTFSRTVEGSDVWRINEAQGAPVQVQPETADVIAKSLEYSRASDGLFDITIGSVSSLWDFKQGVKPAPDAIDEAIKHIDYRGVSVEGDTVRLADPLARIDLGGIAKGYIADDLKRLLRDAGVASACLNLGGNVAVLGAKPDGSPWNVGIQDPNGQAQDVIAAVACVDGSVVTSGLYERQFTEDGTLYYHILDPKTGYPAVTDVVSTSVKTASSTDGDALATTMFLMGCESALALMNERDDTEGLVVSDDGITHLSQGSTFRLMEASAQ